MMINDNIITAGITEKELARRHRTEEKTRNNLSRALNFVLDKLSHETDWVKLSYESLMRDDKVIDKFADRKPFFFLLQSNDHIISRPSQQSSSKDGTIAHTIPMEYKYVPPEEKSELGYDAICFRKIQGDLKEKLVNILSQHKDLKASPWDHFGIYEQYLTLGAKDGWIFADILRISALTGIHIDTVIDVLNDFQKAKIICIRKVQVLDHRKKKEDKLREKTICHLCDPEEYSSLLVEKLDDSLVLDLAEGKRRDTARSISETISWINQIEEEQKLEEEKHPVISIDANLPLTEKISFLIQDELNKQTGMLKQEIASLKKEVEQKELANQKAQKSAKIYEEKLAAAIQDSTDLRGKLREKQAKVEKQKDLREKLVEYNDEFIANAQDAMMIANGRIQDLIQEFVSTAKDRPYELRDEKFVSRFKGKVSQVFSDFSKDITDFSEDKYPPALKA